MMSALLIDANILTHIAGVIIHTNDIIVTYRILNVLNDIMDI